MPVSVMLILLTVLLSSIVESGISLDFEIVSSQIEQNYKRDTFDTAVALQRNVYLTNLAIGSNKDDVVVSIDTGSSELWVMSTDVSCQTVSQLHSENPPDIPHLFNDLPQDYSCAANGTFNTKDSATYQFISNDFSIGFADGSAAIGEYGRDDVGVGNVTIEGLKLGVANASSVDMGILGIGRNDKYGNFVSLLRKQGHINSAQYAIYLNDKTGNILFGSVDDTKYIGHLATTHMENSAVHIKEVWLSSSDSNAKTTIQSGSKHVIFDTGSTFSTLPSNWIQKIGQSLNGTYDDNEMAYQVPCEMKDIDTKFNFKVSNTTLSVPVSDFIINNERTNGKCYLGIMDESLIGGTIFGSDILKQFYVVFNLEDNKLSIAPVTHEDIASESQSSSQNQSQSQSQSKPSNSEEDRFANRSEASTYRKKTLLYVYCISLMLLSIYVIVLY
ncbi:BAR1 [Candida theae]|uniref:candidapepsin n=1 Tax=Candida theae TaxID=1198502 RepID=A0AAD5BF15_9ASCO|nr:BAR1 [Candida theae]KAI5958610.1 BAR1 [Candida theae]